MKKFKNIIKNLSFRKKIAYISLGISLIPVLLLGSFTHIQTRQLLVEREKMALKETLNTEVKNLDSKMESYYTAMNHIIWSDSIRSSLSKKHNSNHEMYLTYRDVIDPMFLTVRTLHSTIDSITMYSDNTIYPHGDILRPLSDITDTSWYDKAYKQTTPFFTMSQDNKSLSLICQMYNKHSSYTNIIRMSIDSESLFRSTKELFDESYGIILLDQNGDVIYQYSNFTNTKYQDFPIDKILVSGNKDNKDINNYVVEQSSISSVPWSAYLYRPIEAVSASANQITIIVFIFILLTLAIVLLSSLLLSKVVVRPLMALSRNMKLIEQGDLTITVQYTSKDEIGSLIQVFRKMVERLKYLIDEVLKSKIAQKEYEMKALQAQINPHFLYNSLSLINGKAIMAGQEDISQMAQLLSTFYRTTLNKGKDLVTVKEELQNTISYAKIQCMMHSNSFDIVYDIDEDTYDYIIPHLLLQPLVENGIIHGIDHKETPDKGILTISCRQEEHSLILKVLDNGCGMTKEQCDNILSSSSKGYGIQNVNHRVQLYYGSDYGLHYTSTKGLGTCATLKIGKVIK